MTTLPFLKKLCLGIFLMATAWAHAQNRNHSRMVTYHLSVADTTVNLTGKTVKALATNGQIPAPTLYFTEGDTAQVFLHNKTGETVSFHWHGLLLPNEQDGVPMLTTRLIKPSETFEYKFPIIQHGTYWYHSHSGFAEQSGQYGAFVIQPKTPISIQEKTIVLSDWTNQKPKSVQRLLKRHTDWYAIKRDAVQSYGQAAGTGNFGSMLWLEWNRMPSMDLADVYYDAFLANGKIEETAPDLRPGETVRLRVINGSSSSYFWLHFAAGKMKIVAADGLDVQPLEVDKLLIATAETYDIEVTLPADGQYEFRATSWDRYKHTSTWLGTGAKHSAQDLPPIDYYALTEEMKDHMAMMPDMTMGKAPKQIPDVTVYPAGTAPDPMKMDGMGHAGMDKKMDMPGHDMKKMDGQMKMEDQKKMDHSKHQMDGQKKDAHDQMDHSMHNMGQENMEGEMKMDGQNEHETGKIYPADQVASETTHAMSGGPMGVMLTGYSQLKKQYPNEVIFDYNMLRAEEPTTLANDNPVRVVHLYLGGNMLRYTWHINNIPLSESDRILIKKGENVRFVMHNTTMMSHPMHLHGHFFRVINQHGEHSPLKHTVNVASMEMTTIEFEATEDKDWFFHCHLLYHMMSGMARVVGYQGAEVPLNSQKKFKHFTMEDKMWFAKASIAAQSNGTWADLSLLNYHNEISLEGDANYDGDYDIEGKWMRYFGARQFFSVYVGAETEGTKDFDPAQDKDIRERETAGTFGARYLLPMLVTSDLQIDHRGQFSLELEREDIPLSKRWRMGASVKYDFDNNWEYTVGTSYILSQYWALSGNYDSDFGWGAGLHFMY